MSNDFIPFAVGGSANVITQSAYAALTSITQNGFQSGIAQSNQLNKVWRQSSIMAAVLGQFAADYSGNNSTDDGTTATLEANLVAAIRSATKTGVILADTGTANAYTAVNAPPLVAGTWVDGVVQQVRIAHANTGASTYAPDGLTAIPIYGLGLQPLQGGELALNGTAVLMRATIPGVNSGNPIAVLMECAGGAQQISPATASQHAVQLGQIGSVNGNGIKLNGTNSPNLLFNGSGEFGSVGWTQISGSGLAAMNGGDGEGTFFYNSTAIVSGTVFAANGQPIPCNPGDDFTISGEPYAVGATAGNVYARIAFFNSSGVALLYGPNISAVNGQPWRYGWNTARAPAGTAYVLSQMVADTNAVASVGGVRFRRVKVERGTTPSLHSQEASIAAICNATKTGVILADTGAANAYTAVNTPALTALPGTGYTQRVNIAHANTGASTYAPDGLTAKPIYGLGLQPLQGGELPVGIAILMYLVQAGVNSGNGAWIIIESLGGALQIAPATQSQHAVQLGQVGNRTGEVCFFAMNTPPIGFLASDGSVVSRTTYAALFATIGTVFGAGDGSTTFALPDMRGRFPRAWDNGAGVDPGRALGSVQADGFASHSHGVTDPTHDHSVAAGGALVSLNPGGTQFDVISGSQSTTPSSTNVSIQSSGGTETRPKNVALLACIKY